MTTRRPGAADTNGKYCLATVIDRLTTSFNWAQVNFGSVWLRPWSYLFVNSAMTDQLYGGLGFVSGGSWDQVLDQQLALVRDGVFVGSVTPESPTAGRTGPPLDQAVCRTRGNVCVPSDPRSPSRCRSATRRWTAPATTWGATTPSA